MVVHGLHKYTHISANTLFKNGTVHHHCMLCQCVPWLCDMQQKLRLRLYLYIRYTCITIAKRINFSVLEQSNEIFTQKKKEFTANKLNGLLPRSKNTFDTFTHHLVYFIIKRLFVVIHSFIHVKFSLCT